MVEIPSSPQAATNMQGIWIIKLKMGIASYILLLLGFLLGLTTAYACVSGDCQLLDLCSSTSDCERGLHCSQCIIAGDFGSRCTRSMATDILSMNKNLPFNRYAWLTTHNSYAIVGEPSQTGVPRLTFTNQEDTVTQQLNNGVRGLMLDMYDFKNDVWLCHSFEGKCYDYTAFEAALKTLQEISAFLSNNPSEIVTIFIEDYVHAWKGLTKVFTAAGLMKYWFPVSEMPKNGEDWPLVKDMISRGHRLVVFTSNASKEASEGIAYQWKYITENQYGDGGMKAGLCPKRAESSSLNDRTKSLVFQNFFPSVANQLSSCKDNSDMLSQMLKFCNVAAGNRWSNFLAVDFYKRSEGGGAFQAVDTLNGKHWCGCDDVHTCLPGATSKACTP